MAYQVLARKWRPKKFADLVGQEHVVRALQNAMAQGRLHHAYLLTGTRGVGKTTIARILAKSLNCEQAIDGEPCGVCSSCTQIDAGRYVDLLEIDAASNTGIDNIREVLENAQYAPTAGQYKVYIIDEVHMLSKSAFNAMLKTLEEPPEHVKFILATTDPQKVPITVLSRCLQFVLRNLNGQQVSGHLAHVLQTEKIPFEPSALNLLGQAAMGSMRDALSLLDQAIALSEGTVTENDVRHMMGAVDKQYIYAMLNALAAHDANALLQQAQDLANRAIGFDHALSEMAAVLQQLAMVQLLPQALASDPDFEVLQQLAHAFSGEEIQLYYQCAIHGKADLSLAPDEYAGFLMTLLRLLAFKPMAAGQVSLQQNIANTQLGHTQDATKVNTPTSGAVVELAADTKTLATTGIASHKPPSVVAKIEPAQHDHQVAHQTSEAVVENLNQDNHQAADLPPWLEDADAPVSTLIETATTEPSIEVAEKGVIHQEVIAEVVVSNHVPPIDVEDNSHPNLTLTSNYDGKEAVISQDVGALVLPKLGTDNWPQIVDRIRTRLGIVQILAENSALTLVDTTHQNMTLAVTKEAAMWAKRENIQRLAQVIGDAYGQEWHIVTEDWTSECGFETPHQVQLRLEAEKKALAVSLLNQDPTANAIATKFGGQWLPETIELK